MSKKRIGQRLKEARVAAGYTQAQAGEATGVSYQAISNYERGINRVESEMLLKLCALYRISVAEALDTEEAKSSHVNDEEALEYLEYLHKRPEMKTLFSVSRKASKEDIETAITLIEALSNKNRRNEGE